MESADNQQKKHHPGSKGTDAMNKRTKEQQQEHRRNVCDYDDGLIGRGLKFMQRVKALAAHFQVSEQQAKTYISWHKQDRLQAREEKVAEFRDDALAQLDFLYEKAIERANYKDALACLETRIKLTGIQAPKQVVSTVNVTATQAPSIDYDKYSLDELRQIQEAQQQLQKLLAPNIIDITPTEEAE
jgi:hypothetical protein